VSDAVGFIRSSAERGVH